MLSVFGLELPVGSAVPPKPEKNSIFRKVEKLEEKIERLEKEARNLEHSPSRYLEPKSLLPDVMPSLLARPSLNAVQLSQAYPAPIQVDATDEETVEILSRVDSAQSELEIVEALSEL